MCERHEFVQRSNNSVGQRWVRFYHLNRSEEEWVSSPKVARLRGIDFRAKPASRVLMVEDVVQKRLSLSLDSRVVNQYTSWYQAVLRLTESDLLISESYPYS